MTRGEKNIDGGGDTGGDYTGLPTLPSALILHGGHNDGKSTKDPNHVNIDARGATFNNLRLS
jgi:hypothetical protein